jgi:hypothetical protein
VGGKELASGRNAAVLSVVLLILSSCAAPARPPDVVRVRPPEALPPVVVVSTGDSRFSVTYGDGPLDPALDDVLRWIPYAAAWRALAQVVHCSVNRVSEAERQAATASHVRDIVPPDIVAGSFSRALAATGLIREVRMLDREPIGAERRGVDVVVRLSVPRWGLLRVREAKPDLLAAFADIRAQIVVLETGAVLWELDEDVTHPDRLPLRAFTRDHEFTRQAMLEVLDRAGRRLASEYLYARSAGQ